MKIQLSSFSDWIRFYLSSFFQNLLRSSEVNICRRKVFQRFVISLVVIAVHKLLQSLFQFLRRFIFSERYHIDRAITDAAKAAYLATVLKYKVEKLEKYQGLESIKELVIDQEFDSKLNKLKNGNPEAFFYWYQISLIRTA